MDVPGGLSTVTFAINERDQIAGYYVAASGAVKGFIRTGEQFQDVIMPGATATIATSINNLGVGAGEYFDTAGHRHGFVATPVRAAASQVTAQAPQRRGAAVVGVIQEVGGERFVTGRGRTVSGTV